MAKTQYKPSRVRSEEERSTGGSSNYITLDEGENFLGYLLGATDPKVDDPGYYEYHEHWYEAKKQSIVCAGPDDCPLCADGDRPKTRAKTLWLVGKDEKKTIHEPPQLRIFNFNYNLIQQFTDMRTEGDKIKGGLFRVSKIDAKKGTYGIMPKNEFLKATDIKAALADPNAPDFDEAITAQLNKQMQGLVLSKRMEDPDDDTPTVDPDDEPTPAKGKGKAAPAKAKKAAEWPDDGLDEQEVVVVSVSEDGNYFTASADGFDGEKNIYTTDDIELDFSELEDGQVVTVTTGEMDSDGDYILTAEPEVAAAEDEAPAKGKAAPKGKAKPADEDPTLPKAIEDAEFTIVGESNEQEGTIPVKSDDLDLEFTLYIMGSVKDMDWDDYEVGTVIKVNAIKDSTDDMVSEEAPEIVKKASAKKRK